MKLNVKNFIKKGYDVETFYESNKRYVEKYCVPKKHCYQFFIGDTYGDGLCCNNGEGYWQISYDSE